MKYGKTLLRNQVPEWSLYYLNYKQLKVLLKKLSQDQIDSNDIRVLEIKDPMNKTEVFQARLDREVSKIDSFLVGKISEFSTRMKKINYQRQLYLSQSHSSSFLSKELDSFKNLQSKNGDSLLNEIERSPPDIKATNGHTTLYLDAYSSHFEIAQLVHHQKTLLSALLAIKFQIVQLQQFRDSNYNGIVKILKKADKLLDSVNQENYLTSRAPRFPSVFSSITFNFGLKAIELADQIQQDLQKTLSFFDPDSVDYMSYGAVLLEKQKLLVNILVEDNVNKLRPFLSAIDKDVKFNSLEPKSKIVEIIFEQACYYSSLSCIKFLLETRHWLLEVRDVDERSILHKIALFGCYHISSSDIKLNGFTSSEILSSESNILALSRYLGNNLVTGQNILNSINYSPLRFDFGATPTGHNNFLNDKDQQPGEDSAKVFNTILEAIKTIYDHTHILIMDIDVFGRRPLHYAALNNYPQLYKAMATYVKENNLVVISEWWYDLDGCSPLFYTILKGYAETLNVILELFPKGVNYPLSTSDQVCQSPLNLASALGYPDIIRLLLQAGASSLEVNENGESALHIVARNGFIECTQTIISDSINKNLLINLKESNSGHTALMLAAMEGHETVCKILIDAGADLSIEDKRGWKSYDYAILNGFIFLSELLSDIPSGTSSPKLSYIPRQASPKKSVPKDNALLDECALVITLGSNDIRSPVDPVVFLSETDLFTELHNLKLIIKANNFSRPLAQVDLPSRGESPIVIRAAPKTVHHLIFDIVPSSPSQGVIARGAWKVDSMTIPCINQAVPLLRTQTMEIVGHVYFEWILVNPFQHPQLQLPPEFQNTNPSSTRVIGHRGMGANKPVAGGAKLQVGENTMLSFVTAAALGAEYVEFDVQVTRDHIPVIYHDFTVTESGYDIPMHALTHQQFLRIYNKVHKLKSPPSPPQLIRRRSNSLDARNIVPSEDHILVRVKGNNSSTIQSPFVTLAATFSEVPLHIGFNMEVKYPMVDEAEEAGFRGSEMEINTFVDSVLKVVGDAPLGRPLMFSSFHPEICLLLSLKQSRIPVFFLSDCGFSRMADARCNSLRAAVRFASSHHLSGLVVLADPLLKSPCLMSLIREAGLACFTYGNANNCVDNVQRQKTIGVDAVIVDSVAAVSKSLKDPALT